MKKIILLILFTSQIINAQNSFFETIKINGEDAVYQEYYSVFKDDNGKQKISGKRYEVTMKTTTYKGIDVGFEMVKVQDGKILNSFNPTKVDYEELVGYPNTSYLIHTKKNSGFVAIDDYIFKLSRISDDGLSFSSIDAIYIRKGSGEASDKGTKTEKKKKKGKFFKKLGATVLKVATNGQAANLEGQGPDLKKALSIDLKQKVKDYLKSMKEKQNNYTLSSKDQKDIAIVKQSVKDHHAYIKRYNDSVWRTPEYQRIRENNRIAKAVGKRDNVTLLNKTGKDLLIIDSEINTVPLSLGIASRTWSCSKDAYIGRRLSINRVTSYKIVRKIYNANSKCGGTVIIN